MDKPNFFGRFVNKFVYGKNTIWSRFKIKVNGQNWGYPNKEDYIQKLYNLITK